MRPNLPFLSAASNALLKPGGLLRWNKQLVKDARLLLLLTEVMKIARLTSPLLDAPRQSLPRPRLRNGRRLVLLFHLGLILNLCFLFFAPSLALLSRLPPSPNFPNCSSPRESALVLAAYLRSHFSVSQPKALRSRARSYLPDLRQATCPVEFHSSFCSPFSPEEFLAAASNLSSSTATGPDKLAYPTLKHLPRSGMDFLLHIFNLSWPSHSFPSIWKTFSIIPMHKMGKPLDSPASFRPISLTSCVSKLFERIIYSSFWNLIPFSLPVRPVSALVGLHLINFCTFLSPFRMGLTNPGRALGRFSLPSISLKLLTMSGIPPFSTSLFWLASPLLCSLDSIFPF